MFNGENKCKKKSVKPKKKSKSIKSINFLLGAPYQQYR